ncbi:DUF357 domain-containing protein [Methanoregula sp.]|jgi:hypothetical protein|uniref:DUF357 domain-containing protein n=1 Tax=Methanoregula sp. TaxID=2052170 RepID=UPI003C1C2933
MRLQDCQDILRVTLAAARSTAPDTTALGLTAASVLTMVSAYESDGRAFFAAGDPVNALAAYWYGFGWMHGGIALGLLTTGDGTPGCPFTSVIESLPAVHQEKLDEKTTRYLRLLDTALRSVSCAPDPTTPAYRFASQVLCIAGAYRERGRLRLAGGHREDALACFSYGHGWLDAGVQAGLFRVLANREIFTV